MKCRKCANIAKYEVVSPFETFYVCGTHSKKYRDNLAAVVRRIETKAVSKKALTTVLDFVERWNKQDAEPEVAEAARILSED